MTKKNALTLLAVFGGLAVLMICVLVLVAMTAALGTKRVPSTVLLELDLEKPIAEYVPDDPIARALGAPQVLQMRDLVWGLERAARDDRVVGLVARVGSAPLGMAQLQEVRDAVLAFRNSGKPAIAYAETFGEVGPGNGAYYLATAFDSIYLQPSGDVGLTGLMVESPFLRGTLEKLGIVPRMDHRHEYKNAMNLFTEERFTDAHRESYAVLLKSWYGQIVQAVSEARGMSPDEVRSVIDRGPFLGSEAVEAGLVDAIAYRDEVYRIMEEMVGEADPLFLSAYARRSRERKGGDTIALIYGLGNVTRGESGYDPFAGSWNMGSDTVTSAFRAAVRDSRVKAIVFRLDCPGGSYVASDAIWRETLRAQAAGKPVIVSMGNLAGSGGYFVAMDADTIVAQPGTVTASIGVLGGKFLTNGLWDKIGLSWDDVQVGENAHMWSSTHDYSEQGWERFQAWLDRVYEDFTSKVADGRDLPKDDVLAIAKGRIWTGEDAQELGLVDELGGYAVAFAAAREAAGIDPDDPIRVRVFPRPRSTLEAFFGTGRESSDAREIAVAFSRTFRPLIRLARQAGLLEPRGVLTMPEVDPVP